MTGARSPPRRSGTVDAAAVSPLPVDSAWPLSVQSQQSLHCAALAKPYEPYRFSLADDQGRRQHDSVRLQPPQHQQLYHASPESWATAVSHANKGSSTVSRPHTADASAHGGLVGAYPLHLDDHPPTFYSPPPPPPAPLPWHVRSNSLPKYSFMATNPTSFDGDDPAGGGKLSPRKASPPPAIKEDYSTDYTAEDYVSLRPLRRERRSAES